MKTPVYCSFLLLLCASVASAERFPDFTQLVELSHRSVVNISTIEATQNTLTNPEGEVPKSLDEEGLGDLFRKFFDDGEHIPRGSESTSLGSGVIVSNDGFVLTNNHVIEDAKSIIVRLHDRRELYAKVIGVDERSDIALLKIQGRNLPSAKLGSSRNLKVGAWVLAIGSPFGFEHSVTAGIVSAKGRALPNDNYVPFIQSDVAINPGNSGGPLFNLRGEVIGINAQIYSRTGGFMGLSFAIPIELAMDVAQQIKLTGSVRRGWLGVVIQEVTRDLAESFAMDKAYGALVARVMPQSPAAVGGLRPGDVIVAFNGETIERSTDLPPQVGRITVGQTARVEIIRKGQARTLKIAIGELSDQLPVAELEDTSVEPQPESGELGLKVVPAEHDLMQSFGLSQGGMLVSDVVRGSRAARAGLRKGDVILMLDNRPVESIIAYKAIIADLGRKKSIPLLVQRQEGPLFIALRLRDE